MTDTPFGAYPSLWMSALIVVTPSTRKSHGGTSRPISSANGSTKPPMQASTWQLAPTVPASAAIAGMSSTTPCGYWGAEPTTSTVRSSTAAAMASTSAVQSSRTGTLWRRTPKRWAALWKAAWALSATTISGSVTPRSALARSRAAFTAHRIDSVPPLVRKPAAESGPWRSSAVHPTTSAWMAPRDGKAIVLRAFSCR